MPLPLHVSAYLWHLMILPVVWIVIGMEFVIGLVRRPRCGPKAQTHSDVRIVPMSAETTLPGSSRQFHAYLPQRDQNSGPRIDPPPTTLSRRRLLSTMAVAIPPIVLAGTSGATFIQLGQFRIRHVDITIPDLPPDLHGLTIAQVTDIHIGKLTRSGMAERIANAVNSMAADLIIFSGDLIDYSLEDLPRGIKFIRGLEPHHGPECLAIIEGNHDLLDEAETFERSARSAGLPILIDEARTIQVPGRQTPVQLLGLCWGDPGSVERMRMEPSTILASMERVLPLREPGTFPILLTHHPHAFDPASIAGLPLTLAGHTHGGQIMLTDHVGAGPVRFHYWTGLYRKGDCQLFVNNGVGNWFPLRYNAPAEIVKITLLSA